MRRSRLTALLVAGLLVGAWLAGCSSPGASQESSGMPTDSQGSSSGSGLFVDGNRLVDDAGSTVVLRGVNRSGSEYACIDGWGVFDGPTDDASVQAMASWGVNVVRVPLNSACWLDVEHQFATHNAQYAGEAYQQAIRTYVSTITAHGMYVILDLQWTGCGTSSCLANWLKPLPDREYAAKFWASVAGMFKDDQQVIFDLFNEPQGVDWSCWRDGGCTIFGDNDANRYVAAGMQEMVDAVREAGAARQPILVAGTSYANDLTGWASHMPQDPSNSLVASVHLYDSSWPCPTAESGSQSGTAQQAITCFGGGGRNSIEGIAAAHPLVFGELGQSGCARDFVDPMLEWIGERGFGVLGWAWNTADCSSFPAMISDYDGTPTAFGAAFRDFFAVASTGEASTSAAP